MLHVGPHKTATSSFQVSLKRNERVLKEHGIQVYLPRDGGMNGSEVAAAARTECESRQYQETRRHISEIAQSSECTTLLISAESLWLIQDDDAVGRLRGLFDDHELRIEILFVRRELDEWRRSYRSMVGASKGRHASDLATPDVDMLESWDGLIAFYQSRFDEVLVVEYERRNVLPRLYAALGVESTALHVDYRHHDATLRTALPWLASLYGRYFAHTALGRLKRRLFNGGDL